MIIRPTYLLCSLICGSLAWVAVAQQSTTPSAPQTKVNAPQTADDDTTPQGLAAHEHRKYESFVKNLNLTPDQQPKVKAVLDNRLAEEQDALKLDPAAKKSRMKEINAESQGKIRALLDQDQLAKYNQSLQDEAARKAARQQQHQSASPQSPMI